MGLANNKSERTGPLARISRRARGYKSDEGGAMIIFGLLIFVIMLVAGGMAVDFMRFERERARIQYTLDRAILASASLSQPVDPEVVVNDYFAKSDLKNYELKVDPDIGVNYKIVSASARTTMNTFFINLLGIDEMPASAVGAAKESVRKIEISLVLDVSGSMGNNGKLENLKDAAKGFIDTLISDDTADQVSINIIPYNMQVNAGQALLDELTVTSQHNESYCVDFADDDFDSVAIDSSATLARTGHFDPFYHNMNHPNSAETLDDTRLFMCPTEPFSEIMLMSQDSDALKARIDAFEAGGNTSIDIGVKWGAYLLDPDAKEVIHGASTIDSAFAERPGAYSDEETLKFLIVMTDGVNTDQFTLDTAYDDEFSNIWYDPDSEWLSIRTWAGNSADADGDGYRDNAEFMQRRPYNWDDFGSGDTNDQGTNCYAEGSNSRIDRCNDNVPFDGPDLANSASSLSNATRLTYNELWSLMGVKYHAYYLQYFRDYSSWRYYNWIDNVITPVNQAQKNDRLNRICTAFKATNTKQVRLFTIGYEVTDDSGLVMEKCATTGDFYKVEGPGISSAFNSIAKTIQRLKLTY